MLRFFVACESEASARLMSLLEMTLFHSSVFVFELLRTKTVQCGDFVFFLNSRRATSEPTTRGERPFKSTDNFQNGTQELFRAYLGLHFVQMGTQKALKGSLRGS